MISLIRTIGKNFGKIEGDMATITMKEMLEAGVHFGHETKRWDPKMKPYIYGARNGIYIIDLQKTVQLFKEAYNFIRGVTAQGESILFVGTKKQAQESIYEEAARCNMFYVNQRWLGGMLTNFQTVKKSIDQLNKLETMKNEDILSLLPKKEVMQLEKQRKRLERALGGIKTMDKLPGAIFVVDLKKERIAVHEARKLGIPSVGIVDTNCDPDEIDHIIPGNDDAIRAIRLFLNRIADAAIEGTQVYEKTLQEEEPEEGITAEGEEAAVEPPAAEMMAEDATEKEVKGQEPPADTSPEAQEEPREPEEG
jgi:small subunit ribosomal protein S2